ncbi:MAG: hypothetical protein ACFE9S_19115 [Candidatus Hermodarchaeota archaeon]
MPHSKCTKCGAIVDLLDISPLGAYYSFDNKIICWNCFKEQKTKKLNIPNKF